MTDETNKPIIDIKDRPHAPFVFFDDVAVFNNYNGIIGMTLVAGTLLATEGKIHNESVVTAYLRGNIPAFLGLRKAIDDALLLGAKTEGGKN